MHLSRRSRRMVAHAAVAVLGTSCLAHFAEGASFTASWLSNGVGSWTTAARWSTNPTVPNNTVSNQYQAIINSAGAIVNLNSAISIDRLTMGDGTLQGNSTLTAGIGINWNGGTISGTGTLNLRGTSNIAGGDHGFSGFVINNGSLATANWSAGDIHSVGTEGGTFNNSGTFNDSTDTAWSWAVTQTPVFNNLAGSRFIKHGTSDVFQEIQAVVNNAGTIDVQTGGLFLDGGGTSSGTFLVAADANLAFSDFNDSLAAAGSPVTTLSASSVVKGLGGVTFFRFSDSPGFDHSNTNFSGKYDSYYTVVDNGPGGQLNFLSGAQVGTDTSIPAQDWYVYSGRVSFDTLQEAPIEMNNLTLQDGEVGGSDSRHLAGALFWSGGTLSGDGVSSTSVDAAMILNGADKFLADHTLIAEGTGTSIWSEGNLHLSNATIYNSGSSTFISDGALEATNEDTLSDSFFTNIGTFSRTGSGSTAFEGIQFDNSGTVSVQDGTLRLAGGGFHEGRFTISATGVLELGSTPAYGSPFHTLDTTSVISGPVGSKVRFTSTSVLGYGSMNIDTLEVVDSDVTFYNKYSDVTGILAPTSGSVASITVDSGGTWTSSSFIQIGSSGEGFLNIVNDGVVSADIIDSAVFDSTSAGHISVDGTLSRLHGTSFLRVANFGTAEMAITGGAQVDSASGIVASEVGSIGTVTVSGAGSKWTNSGNLSIGNNGNATFSISSGALVSNANGAIGDSAAGKGNVHVSGTGTQWNSSGFLAIGNAGSAALLVDSGAHIASTGIGVIASGTTSLGIATITGNGSRWDSAQQIGVGVLGPGTLVISNGAIVTSKKGPSATLSGGILGRYATGTGTVLVSGAGSQWNMLGIGDDGSLNVGFGSVTVSDLAPGGKGFLSVTNGGLVTSVSGFIGRGAGATGTASVGGSGSLAAAWQMSGSLYVGGDLTSPASGGAGTLIVGTLGSVNAPVSTKVWNNGTVLYQNGTFSTGTLELAGGKFLVSAGNNKVVQTTFISTDVLNGSKLDLTNNKAIVNYTSPTPSPADGIRQQIRSGYNNGAWTGNGITTTLGDATHGLGYGDNSVIGVSTFGGVSVDASSVLIRYTYFGDANLDGQVNINDLYALASNYNSAGKLWTSGDFNYDGNVNVTDLTLLAKNWQAGVGSPLPGEALGSMLTMPGLPGISVPEPVGLLALLPCALLTRRRRQHFDTNAASR